VAAQTILNSHDKAFAEEIVGRGFLLFVSGADPSLIMADAATSVAKEYLLKKPPPNRQHRWRVGKCSNSYGQGNKEELYLSSCRSSAWRSDRTNVKKRRVPVATTRSDAS
jgi:hypothetical protein